MDDVIAIKIIPEGSIGSGSGRSSSKSSASTPDNITKGMGSAFGGVMKGLGIASIVGMIAKIVSMNKGLMSVLGGIIKMVGYLLKPITDVIMVLLMPILLVLKPIVMMVNQIMAPFVRQAMLMMREGAAQISGGDVSGGLETITGGVSVMMSGLQVVINGLLSTLLSGTIQSMLQIGGQFLIVVINSMLEFMRPLLQMFGVNVDAAKLFVSNNINDATNSLSTEVGGIVDGVFGTISASASGNAAMISELVGVDSKDFQISANKVLKDVFNDAPNSIKGTWKSMIGTEAGFGKTANDSINSLIGGADGLDTTFTNGMIDMQNHGVTKISAAVTAFNDEFDKLKSTSNRIRNRGILGVIADTAVELTTGGLAETITYDG